MVLAMLVTPAAAIEIMVKKGRYRGSTGEGVIIPQTRMYACTLNHVIDHGTPINGPLQVDIHRKNIRSVRGQRIAREIMRRKA